MKIFTTLKNVAPKGQRFFYEAYFGIAKFGKGTVFAISDPWLYNEYVDGRKLAAEYDNISAGKDLVSWIARQLMKK